MRTIITPKTFFKKFTKAEIVAIMRSNDDDVIYFRSLFLSGERIQSDDPDLAQGMALLVQQGILTSARSAAIMGWTQV